MPAAIGAPVRQAIEREVGGGRQIAERKFVVRAGERRLRLLQIARGLGRHAHPDQHIVGRRGFRLRQPLVNRQRGAVIAERLVGLGLAERRGFPQVAGRPAGDERLERAARIGRAADRELGEAFVVLDVLAQRMIAQQRLRQDRQRLRELPVDLELDGRRERIERRRARRVRRWSASSRTATGRPGSGG